MTTNLFVTPDHQGPKVDITIWVCYVISGLAVTAKLLTKLGRSHRHIRLTNLELDDFVLGASFIFATGQTIAVSQQVSAGLGDHIPNITQQYLEAYEQAGFSSQILYIFTLAAAKVAACLFALNLQPHSRSKAIIRGLVGFIGLWTLTSVLAIAFQCEIPRTWAITSGKCFNQPAFWVFVEVCNGLVDLLLVAILCNTVWILQANAKTMLLCVFAARAIIVAPIVFRVIHIFEADISQSSSGWDPTFQETNVAIATAIVMNTSLVLTCVPFLRPLMEALKPGWSTSDVVGGVGYNVMYGKSAFTSGQYPTGSIIAGQKGKSKDLDQSILRTGNFQLESRSDDELREGSQDRLRSDGQV